MVDSFGTRTIFLHATPAGEPLYAKFGFDVIDTIDQHQGAAFQPPLISLPPGERLRPIGANDGPRLAALASRARRFRAARGMEQLRSFLPSIFVVWAQKRCSTNE
jgi:hypothetical protein